MLKKMLCITGVILLMAFSGTQAAEYDAAFVAKAKALAERGNAIAQCALAECYTIAGLCEGIPQDYVKARQWYEKSAKQGDASAQLKLGVMYHEGKGVRQDYAKARKWLEKAAAQGHAKAQLVLGLMFNVC